MYTKKESAKMMRLYLRLTKIGYHFEHIDYGFGWTAIFTLDHKYVQDTENWMWDFLEGKISSAHILKALQSGASPYELAAASKTRSKGRGRRVADATGAQPPSPPDGEQAKEPNPLLPPPIGLGSGPQDDRCDGDLVEDV